MITLDGIEVKVGDRLWSVACGKFCVVEAMDKTEADYPIVAKEDSWTTDGKLYSYLARDLYWDKVEIIPPPKPKKMVKKSGWINVYPAYWKDALPRAGCIFPTSKMADECAEMGRVLCKFIEWEEPE
jgi:hypothetical protein